MKFFSTFGLPKVVQTDQGTNFSFETLSQVLTTLNISHRIASAYHPESQGALERFHQTLKAMLESTAWILVRIGMREVPLVLFAVREAVQESLGFSPADLVFGHTVRGPLKMLKENMLAFNSSSEVNVLDYVSNSASVLHKACSMAKDSLASAQKKMKCQFDRKSVQRAFAEGDQVLVLLPIVGFCFISTIFWALRSSEKIK